jgi:TRAP-type C4-dicarboxylate transport system permease large subunit
MIFAGMVGSAVADAAGTVAVEVRAMKKAGYRPETAAAISAAAATIGPIIPPSLPMVIYGVGADVSVGRLFLAGVIPGVLMGVSLMIMVAIIAPRQGLARHAFGGLRDVWDAFKGAVWALLAPVILLGACSAACSRRPRRPPSPISMRCFSACRVYRTLRVKDLPAIPINTAETTGIVAVLVMVAGALGWCMSISRIPQTAHRRSSRRSISPSCPVRGEPAAARRRLLHGGAGRDADPDSDPGAGGDRLWHRPGAIRAHHDLQPDPGTIHPPIGVVLFVMARIADVTFEQISRAISLAGSAAGRAGRDHRVAAAHAVAAGP